VLINEKPNQGVREREKVGIHWSRQYGGTPIQAVMFITFRFTKKIRLLHEENSSS
jgi:hypothetical protein